MNLFDIINTDIKSAMLSKDKAKLSVLRGIKAAFLLEATKEGGDGSVSDQKGESIMLKLHKQRMETAIIYREQDRIDLAEEEEYQANVIVAYLPEQLSKDEISVIVKEIILQVGANAPSDMGKVMGIVMGKLKGKADGSLISAVVKENLIS